MLVKDEVRGDTHRLMNNVWGWSSTCGLGLPRVLILRSHCALLHCALHVLHIEHTAPRCTPLNAQTLRHWGQGRRHGDCVTCIPWDHRAPGCRVPVRALMHGYVQGL